MFIQLTLMLGFSNAGLFQFSIAQNLLLCNLLLSHYLRNAQFYYVVTLFGQPSL